MPTYDPTTDLGMVRLLLNDADIAGFVFTDDELQAFLDMEGGSVKRAAAQAIDVNASNIALAMRVLRRQDLQTDGARLADAMRAHADRLRAQADTDAAGGDDGWFEVVDFVAPDVAALGDVVW